MTDARQSVPAVSPTATVLRPERLVAGLERYRARLLAADPSLKVHGSLVRTVGLIMEARGIHLAIGERCFVESEQGRLLAAEVVGFDGGRVLLMAEGNAEGLAPGARVIPGGRMMEVAVGDELLGRVVDGSGLPLDGLGEIKCDERRALLGHPINPMRRALVDEPLDVGVRAINALFSVGRGARLGLFAGSGVGKSILLGMMARYTSADVVVVGLIGERSREVKEFVDRILGADGLKKAVVVAAPASDSALRRVHGAYRATAIAEHFRDRGQQVLLLVDFADPIRDGATRNRAGRRRNSRKPWVSRVNFWQDFVIMRTCRQWRNRLRQHHGVLYRADRRRRSE